VKSRGRNHVEAGWKTAADLYVRIHVEFVRKTAADQGERIRGVAARKTAVDKSVTIHEGVKETAVDQLVHKARVIAEVDLAATPIEGETGKRGRRE
jgi:hypothetical protein